MRCAVSLGSGKKRKGTENENNSNAGHPLWETERAAAGIRTGQARRSPPGTLGQETTEFGQRIRTGLGRRSRTARERQSPGSGSERPREEDPGRAGWGRVAQTRGTGAADRNGPGNKIPAEQPIRTGQGKRSKPGRRQNILSKTGPDQGFTTVVDPKRWSQSEGAIGTRVPSLPSSLGQATTLDLPCVHIDPVTTPGSR